MFKRFEDSLEKRLRDKLKEETLNSHTKVLKSDEEKVFDSQARILSSYREFGINVGPTHLIIASEGLLKKSMNHTDIS